MFGNVPTYPLRQLSAQDTVILKSPTLQASDLPLSDDGSFSHRALPPESSGSPYYYYCYSVELIITVQLHYIQ